jgi:hypothetical protein
MCASPTAALSPGLHHQLNAQRRRLPAAAGLQDGAHDFVGALVGPADDDPLSERNMNSRGRLGKVHNTRASSRTHLGYARYDLHLGQGFADHGFDIKARFDAAVGYRSPVPPAEIHPICGVGDVLTDPDVGPTSRKHIDEVLRASATADIAVLHAHIHAVPAARAASGGKRPVTAGSSGPTGDGSIFAFPCFIKAHADGGLRRRLIYKRQGLLDARDDLFSVDDDELVGAVVRRYGRR